MNNNAAISGGGLKACTAMLSNNIIWDNIAPDGSGLKDCSEPNYSCVQGGGGGEGNIDEDPNFIDPTNHDYHLAIYSPCIDVGLNSNVSMELTEDIDLEQRIFTFDPCSVAIVDIGADEVVTNKADLNLDGVVDLFDLFELKKEWLTVGSELKADLLLDNSVDLKDYSILASQWLWQGGWYQPGASALRFDPALGGYVEIHTPQGCVLNNVYTFTYCAWVCPMNISLGNARIIGKNERALMITYGGVLYGYSNGFLTATSHSVSGTLKTGNWYFVAMTRDAGGDSIIRLYVDGEEAAYQSQNVSTQMTHPHPDWRTEGEWNLMIGSQAWTPGNNIPEAIVDEVAIFDRVLTAEEIWYLYNHGYGRVVSPAMDPIGIWHLDEDGTVAEDSSGNGNHGQLKGAILPTWVKGKL